MLNLATSMFPGTCPAMVAHTFQCLINVFLPLSSFDTSVWMTVRFVSCYFSHLHRRDCEAFACEKLQELECRRGIEWDALAMKKEFSSCSMYIPRPSGEQHLGALGWHPTSLFCAEANEKGKGSCKLHQFWFLWSDLWVFSWLSLRMSVGSVSRTKHWQPLLITGCTALSRFVRTWRSQVVCWIGSALHLRSHLKSVTLRSWMGIPLRKAGARQRGFPVTRFFLRSQSDNQPRWQLQLNGFDNRFLAQRRHT